MITKRRAVKQPERTEDAGPRYFIDIKALEESGRSFNSLLVSCACDDHAKSFRQDGAAAARKGSAKQSPMAIIESCCSAKPGYISPTTPTLEAIFKVLVAHQNAPMSAESVSSELITFGVSSSGQRDISPRVLTRLMENDDFYGFAVEQVEESDPARK